MNSGGCAKLGMSHPEKRQTQIQRQVRDLISKINCIYKTIYTSLDYCMLIFQYTIAWNDINPLFFLEESILTYRNVGK